MVASGEATPAPDAGSRARSAGEAAFGPDWKPAWRASAPGRIELLGNHLDYNGGPVLAAAIDRSVVVLADGGGEPGAVEAVFADTDRSREEVNAAELGDWRNHGAPSGPADYLRGVIAEAGARGNALRSPARLALAGDVPLGFGLSSSAAVCVALVLAAVERPPGGADLVRIAQGAEHRAGAPVGGMDQSASVAGGVVLFDGETLGVERLEPDLGQYVFAVVDSGVKRSVGASAYPTRVREARQALDLAREILGEDVPNAASLRRQHLEALEAAAQRDSRLRRELLRRLRHIVTETARVEEGVGAIRAGDWAAFGHLMTASGRSSAMDYEISHPKVEELVGETLAVDGVLGARMMGGGGGGTALSLLERSAVERLDATLRGGYYRRYEMADRPDLIQVCRFAPGAVLESLA